MAAPTLVSATILADGVTLREVWSRAVVNQSGAHTLSDGKTGAYSSGSTTTTLDFTLSGRVIAGMAVTLSIDAAAVAAVDDDADSNAVSAAAVTNNSTARLQGSSRSRNERFDRIRR